MLNIIMLLVIHLTIEILLTEAESTTTTHTVSTPQARANIITSTNQVVGTVTDVNNATGTLATTTNPGLVKATTLSSQMPNLNIATTESIPTSISSHKNGIKSDYININN